MHKSKSITINAILNAVKTLLSIIFPLITYPYVTRVLHATNLGKVTFAQSIVSYFALFAALGISTYAVREGAKIKKDKQKLQAFSNEVFTTNIITTIIAYLLLFLCVLLIPTFRNYATLILILSSTMLFTTIGVDWVNVIFEDYFIITVRSIFVQLISLSLLFIFIKAENDYYRYAFILALSNIVICSWNFIYCRRYIKVRVTVHSDFKKHIKPLFIFFANNLAISIYCYADTTMLGWMVGDSCVGIYSVAVKAYTVIKSVLASIYTVCIPRLSDYYGNKEIVKFKALSNTVFCGLVLILLPAMTGLIVLSEPIVMFLGGVEYVGAILSLRILSIALVFAVIGGIISNCINIPTGKEKVTLIGTIVAAIVNIVLNFGMIPLFQQNGAAVTTVVAELSVVIVCLLKNKEIEKILDKKQVAINVLHALIGCVGVIGCYFIATTITSNLVAECIVTITLSAFVYSVVLVALKNNYMLLVLSFLKNRLRKGSL